MNQVKIKPFLRGHFHQAAFFAAIGACAMLIAVANGFEARIAAIIYTVSLAGLFGVSSLYHRPNWGMRARRWMRKLDHAAIFVLIAGSATPVCLLGLDHETGTKALWTFWIAAAIGIVKSLLWAHAPKWFSAIVYLCVGWLAALFLPAMITAMGPVKFWLMLTGGFIYMAGALIYAFKWPDPFPKVFGYHEIFHALVVVASGFHFVVVYQLVTQVPASL